MMNNHIKHQNSIAFSRQSSIFCSKSTERVYKMIDIRIERSSEFFFVLISSFQTPKTIVVNEHFGFDLSRL